MSHQVSIDPVDEARIDISQLEQCGGLRVPGAAIDPDHFRHSPVLSVFNEHGHAPTSSTDALEVVRRFWQRA